MFSGLLAVPTKPEALVMKGVKGIVLGVALGMVAQKVAPQYAGMARMGGSLLGGGVVGFGADQLFGNKVAGALAGAASGTSAVSAGYSY